MVRHQVLVLAFGGSNPSALANKEFFSISTGMYFLCSISLRQSLFVLTDWSSQWPFVTPKRNPIMNHRAIMRAMGTHSRTSNQKPSMPRRIVSIILPTVDEMKYFAAFVLLITMCLLDTSLLSILGDAIVDDIRTLVFPAMAIYLVYAMLRKKKLDDTDKLWACLLYNGMVGALAVVAILGQQEIPQHSLSFDAIHYWIIRIMLFTSVLGAIVTAIIFRMDHDDTNTFVTQNFHDTQYRHIAFLIAAIVAGSCVVILSHFYDSAPVILVLGFAYSDIILGLFNTLLPRKLLTNK